VPKDKLCPDCGSKKMHKAYFGDVCEWWRCMDCETVFRFRSSGQVERYRFEYPDGGLVKIYRRARKCGL